MAQFELDLPERRESPPGIVERFDVVKDIGPTRRGKGVKIMAIVDCNSLPLSVSTHAANHHEVTLGQLSFEFYMAQAKPESLIGNKAYNSDALDESLKRQGAHVISPHRSNVPVKSHAQDTGRAALAGGARLRMVTVEAAAGRSMGVLRQQFPGLCRARQHHDPPQTNLRWLQV